jgi:hypothetical protein
MPIIEGARSRNQADIRAGSEYYVDAVDGSDSRGGTSWDTAFLTMEHAFTVLRSGDSIAFVGKIKEQIVTPVQIFDVTIRGAGNRPRHADAAPVPTGGQSAATWTVPASPTAATPLVKVLQQGWRFENILFAGPSDAASVLLFRDGGAGNAERDASHAVISGCRFASGQDGVEQSGGCYNVRIENSRFHDLTGYCIKNTGGAGIAASYRWEIVGNDFNGCANWMGVWDGNSFYIADNRIAHITTALINLSGGTGYNAIVRNTFDIAAADFDPAGGVTGKAGDVWSNYLTDALETGLPAN